MSSLVERREFAFALAANALGIRTDDRLAGLATHVPFDMKHSRRIESDEVRWRLSPLASGNERAFATTGSGRSSDHGFARSVAPPSRLASASA